MACTYTPVQINKCPEVIDLSINNMLLCDGCCIPSTKYANVAVDTTIVSGDLVTIDPATNVAILATNPALVSGVADCSATATADCPGAICVYVRDAVLKCGSVNYGNLDPTAVNTRLEELRIFLAVTV
jgi:hypothetical protein